MDEVGPLERQGQGKGASQCGRSLLSSSGLPLGGERQAGWKSLQFSLYLQCPVAVSPLPGGDWMVQGGLPAS